MVQHTYRGSEGLLHAVCGDSGGSCGEGTAAARTACVEEVLAGVVSAVVGVMCIL